MEAAVAFTSICMRHRMSRLLLTAGILLAHFRAATFASGRQNTVIELIDSWLINILHYTCIQAALNSEDASARRWVRRLSPYWANAGLRPPSLVYKLI